MKKILLVVACLLFLTPLSNAGYLGIVDRTATRDTLAIPFNILDSLGNAVDDATGDSVFIIITSPAGVEVYTDSMLFTDSRIVEYVWEDYGNAYTFHDRVSILDGSSTANGIFSYNLLVHDQNLALQTSYTGTFQIINSILDAALDSIARYDQVDSLYDTLLVIQTALDAVRDSLQYLITATGFSTLTEASNIGINWGDIVNQGTIVNLSLTAIGNVNSKTGYSLIVQDWTTDADLVPIAKEASLYDPTTDSVLLSNREEIASEFADTTLNKVLTGATFNIQNSLGKRVRELAGANVISSGDAQAGSATTITLASGEPSTSSLYSGLTVIIVGGTGVGQVRHIHTYDGGTKVATLHPGDDWTIEPVSGSEYEIVPGAPVEVIHMHDSALVDISMSVMDSARGDTMIVTMTDTTSSGINIPILITAEFDTLFFWSGYGIGNKSHTDYDSNRDTIWIVTSDDDTIGILEYYHIGGTAGDPPDTVKGLAKP